MKKRLLPYLVFLVGLFLLFYMGMAVYAGIFLLLGIVMIIESIWPEKWEADNKKTAEKLHIKIGYARWTFGSHILRLTFPFRPSS